MTRMLGRLRVVDALVVAAGALLVLKLVSFLAGPPTVDGGEGGGVSSFARVLSFARTNYQPPDPDTTGSVPPKDAAAAPTGASAAASDAGSHASSADTVPAAKGSPSERALRERLGERREELERRVRELEAREKLIGEAERRVDSRVDEAKRAEEKAATTTEAEKGEAAAIKGLVIMYETMKPKDAARVFDRLPQEVLVPVVRQIAPRKMAEIMAALSPEVAQKLTVALARPTSPVASEPAVGGLPPGELPAIEPAGRPARPPR